MSSRSGMQANLQAPSTTTAPANQKLVGVLTTKLLKDDERANGVGHPATRQVILHLRDGYQGPN